MFFFSEFAIEAELEAESSDQAPAWTQLSWNKYIWLIELI